MHTKKRHGAASKTATGTKRKRTEHSSFINLDCLQYLPGQLNLKAKLNLPPEQQYRAHNCVCKEARQYNRVAEHCTMQPDNSGSCHDTIGPSEEPDRQTTRALRSQRPGDSI